LAAGISESYMAQIRQVIAEAERTDYIMPIWLPYLGAILGVIVLTVLLIGRIGGGLAAAGAGILLLAVVVGAIVNLYVIYKWISRRNSHFERIQRLQSLIIEYLQAKGVQDPELASMRSILEEARFREQRRSPGLWLILYLVIGFIAWAYIMHFLTRDFAEHEHREHMFLQHLAAMLKRRNIALPQPDRTIPNRNTVLYLILTIITLGLFGLYWIYTVTKDPNNHFLTHRKLEPQLAETLAKL